MVLLLVAGCKNVYLKIWAKKGWSEEEREWKNIYLHNIEYLYIELEVFFLLLEVVTGSSIKRA